MSLTKLLIVLLTILSIVIKETSSQTEEVTEETPLCETGECRLDTEDIQRYGGHGGTYTGTLDLDFIGDIGGQGGNCMVTTYCNGTTCISKAMETISWGLAALPLIVLNIADVVLLGMIMRDMKSQEPSHKYMPYPVYGNQGFGGYYMDYKRSLDSFPTSLESLHKAVTKLIEAYSDTEEEKA
ncbi:uncharacterized protein LOC143030527 [Oratosquilla oratoria]|uniref:uncharacterized protein LOC143030527 n=1 Tax=Oratosquilla oratoria TaxID=337810 RepID=UPI003F762F41